MSNCLRCNKPLQDSEGHTLTAINLSIWGDAPWSFLMQQLGKYSNLVPAPHLPTMIAEVEAPRLADIGAATTGTYRDLLRGVPMRGETRLTVEFCWECTLDAFMGVK